MNIYQPVISGSLTVTGSTTFFGNITVNSGSLTVTSGSLSGTASYALTSSFADSFNVAGNLTASAALVTGTLTAQTLVVQTITSSIVYSSGSNRFGNLLTDRQTFTGSVNITGSALYVNTSGSGDILDIQKSQNAITNFYFRNTDSTNASSRAYLNVVGGTNRISLYSLHGDNNYINMAYGNFYIQMNQSSSVINPFFINTNGYIGIGTSTVTEGTQPASSISIFPSSSVSNGPLIQFPGNGRIRPAATSDRLSIDGNALYLNGTFSGTVAIATGGGNVGIGTTSPNYKLDVSGSMSAIGIFGNSYAQTSATASGGISVIDTGIAPPSNAIYLVTVAANPNGGGSGLYYYAEVGYIICDTQYNGSAAVNYINYTKVAGGPSSGTPGVLTVSAVFLVAGVEVSNTTTYQPSNSQIRIKISGYNSSFIGQNQQVRLTQIQ